MMGLDDIMISFAVSVGAGIATNLIEEIRSNKDLDARMNKCFNNALNKWEISQETRNNLHSESLNFFPDLSIFLSDPAKGINPKIKELLRLWIKEMQNDEVCANYIISHKQDVANCKLNDVLVLLKNDILTTINQIAEGQEKMLRKQDVMMNYLESFQAQLQKLKQDAVTNHVPNLLALLKGSIAEMIEDLKLTTAKRIIEEIEKQFASVIETDQELKSEIAYRKGLTLLFSQSQKAIELFHEAYFIRPDVSIYIQLEIRRCLAKYDYETARKLSEKLGDDKYKSIVDIVSSDNSASVFAAIPENIKDDMEVRQIVLDSLVMKKEKANCAFLFDDKDVELPKSLKLSNICQWLFLLSKIRYKTGDFIALSFAAPQINNVKSARKAINLFWKELEETELKESFPLISCLHSYWNFLCTHDKSWADSFLSIDRTHFGDQKIVFNLMETSVYVLLGKQEEAFAALVSASKELDINIIRVAIMLFIQTNNIMHLVWLLGRMKEVGIKVNDEIAVLLAQSMQKENAEKVRVQLDNIDFEKESVKELLIQLANFNSGKEVRTEQIKKTRTEFCDELKAYAANLLAYVGDTELAFDMLKPIVDEDTPDLKRHIFLTVLDKMQEKTPELYRILIKNRQAGNYCDDRLLKKEYQLDSQIGDYNNALAAITMLYERNPENVEFFVHFLFTTGHVCPILIKQYEEKTLNLKISDPKLVALAYRAFSENGYIETAAELLYNAAKASDDYELRTFYYNETLTGMISNIAGKEYDVAEEGKYVLCDKDGQRLFYLASDKGSCISKAMLGARKDDEVDTEIGFKPIKLKVIGIYNKYYKLAGDIIREAKDGSNPGIVPFEIDMEHPLESLESFIRKMSKDVQTPKERRKAAYAKYERGEIGLLQLVDDNNMLSGYYKYLFTPFRVHVNISSEERCKIKDKPVDAQFVLDLPTIITFAEFTAKTGNKIKGQKTITKLLHEYLKSANKSAIRIADRDFYDAMSMGNLFKYSEYLDVDAKEHIQKLLEWTDANCTDVIADKALELLQQGNNTPLKNQLLSSLSLLLDQKCYFVTDDSKIASMLPMAKIITSETYLRLFNDKQVSKEYSEFLLDHGFVGVELDTDYVCDEYQKAKYGNGNKLVAIMQNVAQNPYQISVTIEACIKLASTEVDINTLKVTFTNMFAMALKGFIPDFRNNLVNSMERSMNLPFAPVQITRQCLIDALVIANS
ncbi:MAG: hypothetical protein UH850_13875 [Paludibacteraceae bacterium]|nr:hypothetical protein [Paludibacteraceae bacterium]